LIQQAASLGSSMGMFLLGDKYYNGSGGVPLDLARAADLFRQAADLGCREALHAMAICFYNGRGVVMDRVKAFQFWKQGANLGSSTSIYNLALEYHKGTVVPKNLVLAKKLYKQAAALGNVEAATAYAHLVPLTGAD
jgi:uncharacterized protein